MKILPAVSPHNSAIWRGVRELTLYSSRHSDTSSGAVWSVGLDTGFAGFLFRLISPTYFNSFPVQVFRGIIKESLNTTSRRSKRGSIIKNAVLSEQVDREPLSRRTHSKPVLILDVWLCLSQFLLVLSIVIEGSNAWRQRSPLNSF